LSLRALQSEIDRKAQEEASSILETAKAEAEKIIAEANAKAANLRDERTKALRREIDAQEKAELAVARMDRNGDLLRVKSRWTIRVFEEVEKRVTKMAESGGREYSELLANFTLEGISKMNGSKFIVETSLRDKEAISKVLGTITERASKVKNDKVTLHLETLPTRTLGGAVVSTEDRVQYFNNTLEARLAAASRKLEGTIRQILFGPGDANE
jgi:V/A-type H+-transporting ATPase subunit E